MSARARAVLLALLLPAAAAGAASAQSDPPLPSRAVVPDALVAAPWIPDPWLAERERQAAGWLEEYDDWKAWFARWHNRREPGFLMGRARGRRPRPEPPDWLGRMCDTLVDPAAPFTAVCAAWREWVRGDFFAEIIAQRREEDRAVRERPRKSVWWQHVHLDALWPMAQSGSSIFGVLGMHVTLPLTRRTAVFVAPGAILVRLPSGAGERRWSTATDWGFSYRLFDFTMPVNRRPATIHLNIARVWLLGSRPQTTSRDLYLAGFSVTLAPK